jgi:hypothetical protein
MCPRYAIVFVSNQAGEPHYKRHIAFKAKMPLIARAVRAGPVLNSRLVHASN